MYNENSIVKILISGEGGQGVQVMAKILANAAFKQQYHVVYMPHYGVEMRMGISLAYLQIGTQTIHYPKFELADILVGMTARDLAQTKSFIKRETVVINAMNLSDFMTENKLLPRSLNMLILGILTRKFKDKLPLETEKIRGEIKQVLGEKQGLMENLEAFTKGINLEERYYNQSLDKYPRINLSPKTTFSKEKDYYHWSSHCKGCGICIEKCPVNALFWSKTLRNYFDQPVPEIDIEKCIACDLCEQLCPDMAIKVVKKK